MPVNGASSARTGAQGAQLAHQTGPLGSDVFPGQTLGVQAPRSHDVVSWTTVGIGLCLVAKMLVGINALASAFTSDRIAQELHVGSNPGFLTANQIANAAVARISNHGSHRLIGAIFMSFNEAQQL